MVNESVAEITQWVDEYARDQGIDHSNWRILPQQHSCMVSEIPTEDQAMGLSRYLRQHRFMAEVLAPTAELHTWSVVVLLP